MAYEAYTVDVKFRVPGDKIADALAAFNAEFNPDADEDQLYTSLSEAVETESVFELSSDPSPAVGPDFDLGDHPGGTHYIEDEIQQVLAALAPFAEEGSYVRFKGEDDALWGFRVVNGQLEDEVGAFTWRLND